jgi:hypothetical protein
MCCARGCDRHGREAGAHACSVERSRERLLSPQPAPVDGLCTTVRGYLNTPALIARNDVDIAFCHAETVPALRCLETEEAVPRCRRRPMPGRPFGVPFGIPLPSWGAMGGRPGSSRAWARRRSPAAPRIVLADLRRAPSRVPLVRPPAQRRRRARGSGARGVRGRHRSCREGGI